MALSPEIINIQEISSQQIEVLDRKADLQSRRGRALAVGAAVSLGLTAAAEIAKVTTIVDASIAIPFEAASLAVSLLMGLAGLKLLDNTISLRFEAIRRNLKGMQVGIDDVLVTLNKLDSDYRGNIIDGTAVEVITDSKRLLE